MAYSKTIINSIGNEFPRKNKYLFDLAIASKTEAKAIKKNKDNHSYNIKMAEYLKNEKEHLNKVLNDSREKFSDESNRDIKKLKIRLYKAERNSDFYESYKDLTYDAELKYLIALAEFEQIPEILKNNEDLKEKLKNKENKLNNIDNSKRLNTLEEIKKEREELKDKRDKSIREIKDKLDDGLISNKAYKNEKQKKNREYHEETDVLSYKDEKKSLEQEIKNIKHHIKIDAKSKINVLESDISDIRRKTPVEVEKERAIFSYLTIPFPGVGQLLNGQFIKALLFFIGTLFIYFIAIPYALGYGNYRGNGIEGLLSLARGGKRLDKSLIFMIEGIIAIMLVLISIFLFIMSFKDVNRVEKDTIKGIRKKSWFETKNTLSEEGFPYIVSSPAFLLVLFIVIVPVTTTFLISFTNMDPNHQNKFTWLGLKNYKMVLTGKGAAGSAFWPILKWTFLWTLGSTTLAIAIGFILALLANQDRIKFKGVFRTIYLLPWAVPAFITIMFFSLMVARRGPIPNLIANITEAVTGKALVLDIKNNTSLTRISLILLQGWLGSAYIFLLSTGILQSIPNELYEAAEIDGATGFQRTRRITIPLVLYQTAPLLINQYTFNFNNYSIIELFNGGGPFNPLTYGNLVGSSDILISYIFKLTVNNNYQAIGAAVTIMVSIFLMFLSWLGFKNTKAFKEI